MIARGLKFVCRRSILKLHIPKKDIRIGSQIMPLLVTLATRNSERTFRIFPCSKMEEGVGVINSFPTSNHNRVKEKLPFKHHELKIMSDESV